MQNKFLLLTSILVTLFSGCSSKQYYKPTSVESIPKAISSTYEIINFSRDGATLENRDILTKNRRLKLNIPKDYFFINRTKENIIIIANREGDCKILKDNSSQNIKFPKALIAGTVMDNKLIYLLKDNSFGIYNLSTKSIAFNSKGEKTYSIDTRVANPIRVDKLAVVPLLNGKVDILDLSSNRLVKEIFISGEKSLNNIIFIKRLKNILIVATPHKLVAISNRGKREFKREISEVALDKDNIFVFTKDGTIARLNDSLVVQDEKKFKFAHFSVATIYKNRVYALDKQGYLIVTNSDFTKYKVYKFSKVDGYSFISGKYIYYSGNKIDMDRLSY